MTIDFKHSRVFYALATTPRCRYIINEGGTRSGKTWSLLTYFLILCLSNKGARKVIQVFRKTFTSCHRTAFKDFCEILDAYNLWGVAKLSKQSASFEIMGNTIEFCGADQAQKLRGSKRYHAWLNETNEFSEEDFKQIKLRTESKIFFDYNPSFTDSWIYDLIEAESETPTAEVLKQCVAGGGFYVSGNKRVALIQSTYKDNPFLAEEIRTEIENLKKYNDDDYNIYALGIRSNPSGFVFKRVYYSVYDTIPPDAVGAIYCDPNLSLKGKGDTTAVVKMLYSRSTGLFYIDSVICRSFSDPKELLTNLLNLYSNDNKIRFIGFDGNFAQESSWTAHVEAYSKIQQIRFPLIDYKRYRVDETLKTTQFLWNDRQILFNRNIEFSEEGRRFLDQVYSFNGKKNTKAGKHDDAPDAMICCINYLYDLGLVNYNSTVADIINNIMK